MESLGLLVGHLLGDYILQDDWQAKWKTGGPTPTPEEIDNWIRPFNIFQDDSKAKQIAVKIFHNARWWKANTACTIHCTLYTLAVWACSFWWMPWWGLAACFLAHYPVDRYRLARKLMNLRHEQFATGIFSPWSIIIVDNTIHLLVLLIIGTAHNLLP